VRVEEIRNKGKIELRVTGDKGCRCKELAAFEFVGVVENLFGALKKVACLEWSSRAKFRCELIQEDGVIFAVLDIGREVRYPDIMMISFCS